MVNTFALECIRRKNGYTQGDLAKLLGLKTYRSYMKREKGTIDFTDKEKVAMAKLFNMNLEEFYFVFFNNEFQMVDSEKLIGIFT